MIWTFDNISILMVCLFYILIWHGRKLYVFLPVFYWRLVIWITLPETNIAPENGWLEYYCPIGFRPIFRGENVSFREGIIKTTLESGWCGKPSLAPVQSRSPGAHTRDVATNQWWKGGLMAAHGNVWKDSRLDENCGARGDLLFFLWCINLNVPGTWWPFVYKWLAINWMIPDLYLGNGWKSPNIHLKLVV